MLDWWCDLPWWLRYGFALLMLLISTILFFCGIFWPWGWAMGLILLLLSGRSQSEKDGYNF